MTRYLLFAAISALAACGDVHPTAPDALCEMFGDCATARETFPAGIPRSHCA